MLGVVNVFPVPMALPPANEVYHSIVAPAEALACKLTVPVPQRSFAVVVCMVGKAITVTLTGAVK